MKICELKSPPFLLRVLEASLVYSVEHGETKAVVQQRRLHWYALHVYLSQSLLLWVFDLGFEHLVLAP